MHKAHLTLIVALATLVTQASAQQKRPPILDMHMRAEAADAQGPPPLGICTPTRQIPAWDPAAPWGDTVLAMLKKPACPDPVWSPETDEEMLDQTLVVMERRNVIGILSGQPGLMKAWQSKARERFIPSLGFQAGENSPSPDALRRLFKRGDFAVLGEVTNQDAGIAPDDERMEPYWALAEELEIPVGLKVGPGLPGTIYLDAPLYRARLSSPLTIEEVLVRHPKLRVYLMGAGFPMTDDLLALFYAHPQVYVDVGYIVYSQPRATFYRFLQAIFDAGFIDRVMFASDQMVWPDAIERAITTIEQAPFLSDVHKRAVLYDNAARFLRLTDEVMASHR